MRRSSFTLVEMLLVVVVIAGLAAIIVPNFQLGMQRAYGERCTTALMLIENAKDSYMIDFPDQALVGSGDTSATGYARLEKYMKYGVPISCPIDASYAYTNILSLTSMVACPVNGGDRDVDVGTLTKNGYHDLYRSATWEP